MVYLEERLKVGNAHSIHHALSSNKGDYLPPDQHMPLPRVAEPVSINRLAANKAGSGPLTLKSGHFGALLDDSREEAIITELKTLNNPFRQEPACAPIFKGSLPL